MRATFGIRIHLRRPVRNLRIHLHKNELDVSEKQLMTLLRAALQAKTGPGSMEGCCRSQVYDTVDDTHPASPHAVLLMLP